MKLERIIFLLLIHLFEKLLFFVYFLGLSKYKLTNLLSNKEDNPLFVMLSVIQRHFL